MLGLVLIYFVGKTFYELAQNHEKNRWLFAILGVLSYYAGSFLVALGIVLYRELMPGGFLSAVPDLAIDFIAMPFGLLSTWLFYYLLNRSWSKNDLGDGFEMFDREL